MQTRSLFRTLAAMSLLSAATALVAAEPAQSQTADILKSILREFSGHLRALGSRQPQVAVTPTATAGIRGAEATESELKPYWKGDREQDPGFKAERQELRAAQDLADAGKFAEAARAFSAFADAHPRSPLAPDARFGAALSQAALGDKASATSGFKSFVKENPQHPLTRDAERALAALR